MSAATSRLLKCVFHEEPLAAVVGRVVPTSGYGNESPAWLARRLRSRHTHGRKRSRPEVRHARCRRHRPDLLLGLLARPRVQPRRALHLQGLEHLVVGALVGEVLGRAVLNLDLGTAARTPARQAGLGSQLGAQLHVMVALTRGPCWRLQF